MSKASITEGYVQVEGGRVWYQRFDPTGTPHSTNSSSAKSSATFTIGSNTASQNTASQNTASQNTASQNTASNGSNLASNEVPLLVLHGGPGSAHLGMLPLQALAEERPVIFYDQLGCGHSDRPTDKALWTTERYVRELATLREALGLTEVHILGHSWGTMLLCDYLLTQPTGVKSAVFSSPCLSAPRWVQDADRYRQDLPRNVQATLKRCEENGTTDSKEYKDASEVYMKRHVCRVEIPKEQKEARKWAFGEEVYQTMWGPSEFHPTGVLKTYDRTHRLHEIDVPSLYCCGEYDEASPESTHYYHTLTTGSQFQVLKGCSHSPLREDLDSYLQLIRKFLSSIS